MDVLWSPASVNHGEKFVFPSPAAGRKRQKSYHDSQNQWTQLLPVPVQIQGFIRLTQKFNNLSKQLHLTVNRLVDMALSSESRFTIP